MRLKDVLAKAGVKDGAVYSAHYGNDVHLSGDFEKEVISRGLPIGKAMVEDGIITDARWDDLWQWMVDEQGMFEPEP